MLQLLEAIFWLIVSLVAFLAGTAAILGIPAYIIWRFVKFSVDHRKLREITNKAASEMTEEDADRAISHIGKMKVDNDRASTDRLRACFQQFNESDISADKKKELREAIRKNGVPINERIKQSEQEIKKQNYRIGKQAEEDVRHNLEYSLKPLGYEVLNNVRIPGPEGSQEIDHMVIGKNGVFHLETKGFAGEGQIVIDDDGNWQKVLGDKQHPIKSPVAQIDRHDSFIRSYLADIFPEAEELVVPMVVVAADGFSVNGKENSPVDVYHVNNLTPHIKNYEQENILDDDIVKSIYRKLEKFEES